MRMYRKKQLRPRVWAALIALAFIAGMFCGVLCEAMNTQTERTELVLTGETVQDVAEVLPRY